MRTNRNQRHALLCVLQRLHVKMFKAASIGPSAYYLLEWYEGGYELVKQVYQKEFGQAVTAAPATDKIIGSHFVIAFRPPRPAFGVLSPPLSGPDVDAASSVNFHAGNYEVRQDVVFPRIIYEQGAGNEERGGSPRPFHLGAWRSLPGGEQAAGEKAEGAVKSLSLLMEQCRKGAMTRGEILTARQIAADFIVLLDEICKLDCLNEHLREENAELKNRLSKRSKRSR